LRGEGNLISERERKGRTAERGSSRGLWEEGRGIRRRQKPQVEGAIHLLKEKKEGFHFRGRGEGGSIGT